MNNYCTKLKFPNLNVDLTSYRKEHRNHIRAPKDIMGSELDDILLSVGIKLFWVEAFYLGKNADHTIHCDGHELDDKAKLNYVVGGKDSLMTWYTDVESDKIEKRTSWANTIYLGINTEEITPSFSTTMEEGFYIVHVGKFHNVWNKDEERYCLSACLIDSITNHRLTYTELQIRLKDYIDD
jgi:hypothetical protein